MVSKDDDLYFGTTKSNKQHRTKLQVVVRLAIVITVLYACSTYYFKHYKTKDTVNTLEENQIFEDEEEKLSPLRFPDEPPYYEVMEYIKTDKLLPPPSAPLPAQCDKIDDDKKFDCFPRGTASKESCESRGCCWAPVKNKTNLGFLEMSTPYCYYPKNYVLYKFVNLTSTDYGVTGFMNLSNSSPYPDDAKVLKIDVKFETESRLHIKIYDAEKSRFEPPYPEVPIMTSAAKDTKYIVNVDKQNIGFSVVRRSDNKVIFDTAGAGGFIFADQFLQLSAFLPTKYIYGLGIHRDDFLLDMNWKTYTLWNLDQGPISDTDLYASHPFFLGLEEGGSSYGVFLLNSNAMDVILQPAPAITYRTIGGVLDFYFFLGPSPGEVVQQYTELVGRPAMPPYWSLGFHLCRWGYKSLDHVKEIYHNNSQRFLDAQWLDIDYMNNRNDFTYDPNNFSGIKDFVSELKNDGRHFVIILDPGVSGSEKRGAYPPYDDAVKMDVLVKNDKGQVLVGKVWNAESTVFPDFTHPKAVDYWMKQVERQYTKEFTFDGLWIDMNEPSNFVQGSDIGCPDNSLENPPYVPQVLGNLLRARTLCMTAKHYKGTHYNIHNLHAMSQAIVTNFVLTTLTKKRPFIISRASFSGQGKYSGVWSGDVTASWEELYHSIPDILTYNILGIPMVGADICGFVGNTTVNLCRRWFQLGAFYTFSRSHNELGAIPQDPASMGEDVIKSFLYAYEIRYLLLPYLYTLFWKAHTAGDTVIRPLFFEFPADVNTYGANRQFMWGPGLLIVPALEEGLTYVKCYLPKGRWFDYESRVEVANSGVEISIPAPLDRIPLLLRGGHILPQQEPSKTTTESRKNPMRLLVVPDGADRSTGTLFWDDGESIEAYERGSYNLIEFVQAGNSLSSRVVAWRYATTLTLGTVEVLGLRSSVTKVTLDGRNVESFKYNATSKSLGVMKLEVDLSKPFHITWSS